MLFLRAAVRKSTISRFIPSRIRVQTCTGREDGMDFFCSSGETCPTLTTRLSAVISERKPPLFFFLSVCMTTHAHPFSYNPVKAAPPPLSRAAPYPSAKKKAVITSECGLRAKWAERFLCLFWNNAQICLLKSFRFVVSLLFCSSHFFYPILKEHSHVYLHIRRFTVGCICSSHRCPSLSQRDLCLKWFHCKRCAAKSRNWSLTGRSVIAHPVSWHRVGKHRSVFVFLQDRHKHRD